MGRSPLGRYGKTVSANCKISEDERDRLIEQYGSVYRGIRRGIELALMVETDKEDAGLYADNDVDIDVDKAEREIAAARARLEGVLMKDQELTPSEEAILADPDHYDRIAASIASTLPPTPRAEISQREQPPWEEDFTGSGSIPIVTEESPSRVVEEGATELVPGVEGDGTKRNPFTVGYQTHTHTKDRVDRVVTVKGVKRKIWVCECGVIVE